MNTENDGSNIDEAGTQQISLDDALQLAIRLHQANQFEYAEDVYRQILQISPDNPNALHFFGLLRHQRGFTEEGVELIEAALRLVPEYVDALNNLGNIYLQTGRPELAEPYFRRVIELNPDFAAAYGNLSIALKRLEQFNQAIEIIMKVIAMEPGDAHHYRNLGNVYREMKQYDDAVGAFRQSLLLKPFDAETYRKLSNTFYIMGEIENCIDILKQWLNNDPENSTAMHMYAAYTGTNIPDRASDTYVRQTFDGFAASFDAVLKRLDYQAPYLVQNALQALQPQPDSWRLLDAGCGTGLSGALLRPLVKQLAGVDLSPKMLQHAKHRGVYDELFESELTAFFAQSTVAYDAICCVDTFCYFGDLSVAVQAAVNALKPSGWFIFTLEKLDDNPSGKNFQLNLHGRYSHTELYVRNVLSNAGFAIKLIENAVLRNERKEQVAGLVVTAQMPYEKNMV